MTLTTALNALASLTIPGVRHNYGIATLPERIGRAALPALLVIPTFDDGSRRDYGEFRMGAPAGSQALIRYAVTHLLLHAPIGAGTGANDELPTLITLLDNYAAVLKTDPRLGGTLYYPASYTISIAPVDYGGSRYFGARLWHTWTISA